MRKDFSLRIQYITTPNWSKYAHLFDVQIYAHSLKRKTKYLLKNLLDIEMARLFPGLLHFNMRRNGKTYRRK